jgi:hypothetical protein
MALLPTSSRVLLPLNVLACLLLAVFSGPVLCRLSDTLRQSLIVEATERPVLLAYYTVAAAVFYLLVVLYRPAPVQFTPYPHVYRTVAMPPSPPRCSRTLQQSQNAL